MAFTEIQKVRIEVGDTDESFPILSNEEYEYFLEKNNSSVLKAAIDAAKTILFKLSMRTREDIDIFSVHGQQAAANYIQALKLYIRESGLNPVLQSVRGYVGGVSKSDMEANDSNADNNLTPSPFPVTYTSNDPFKF